MKFLALALALAAMTAPGEVANPMDALRFYDGTWSCVEQEVGSAPLSSTFTFATESNLMREWIARPTQRSMRAPYVVNATFAYDSKHRRYVETEMDNEAAWYVSVADPPKGDTIHWVDLATSTKPSHWEMTRIDSASFTVRSFAKLADSTPNYTAICKRNLQ
jgi:hypothetical protein